MVRINIDSVFSNVSHCVKIILFGRGARRGSRSALKIDGAGLI